MGEHGHDATAWLPNGHLSPTTGTPLRRCSPTHYLIFTRQETGCGLPRGRERSGGGGGEKSAVRG